MTAFFVHQFLRFSFDWGQQSRFTIVHAFAVLLLCWCSLFALSRPLDAKRDKRIVFALGAAVLPLAGLSNYDPADWTGPFGPFALTVAPIVLVALGMIFGLVPRWLFSRLLRANERANQLPVARGRWLLRGLWLVWLPASVAVQLGLQLLRLPLGGKLFELSGFALHGFAHVLYLTELLLIGPMLLVLIAWWVAMRLLSPSD